MGEGELPPGLVSEYRHPKPAKAGGPAAGLAFGVPTPANPDNKNQINGSPLLQKAGQPPAAGDGPVLAAQALEVDVLLRGECRENGPRGWAYQRGRSRGDSMGEYPCMLEIGTHTPQKHKIHCVVHHHFRSERQKLAEAEVPAEVGLDVGVAPVVLLQPA